MLKQLRLTLDIKVRMNDSVSSCSKDCVRGQAPPPPCWVWLWSSAAFRRWRRRKKQANRPIAALIHAAAAQPRMPPLREVPVRRRERRDLHLMEASGGVNHRATALGESWGGGEGQHLAAPSDASTHQPLSLKYSPAHTHPHTHPVCSNYSGED